MEKWTEMPMDPMVSCRQHLRPPPVFSSAHWDPPVLEMAWEWSALMAVPVPAATQDLAGSPAVGWVSSPHRSGRNHKPYMRFFEPSYTWSGDVMGPSW